MPVDLLEMGQMAEKSLASLIEPIMPVYSNQHIKKAVAEPLRLVRPRMWCLLGDEDGVFCGFGDAELHDLLGGDLDGLACGRIATHAGFAVHKHELA